MAEQHLAQVLVLTSEEAEEEWVQLSGGQLPFVSEQDECLHQAPAQGWVQHSIVRLQELDDLSSEALCILGIALADLHQITAVSS